MSSINQFTHSGHAVTFSSQCLQYKTDQQADLKKVEKLNSRFFSLMATGSPPSGELLEFNELALFGYCRPSPVDGALLQPLHCAIYTFWPP